MSTAALLANYLFVGPLIEDRLQAALPGVPVEAIEQLAQAGAEDARQRAVYVMWDGDRFGDSVPSGVAQIVTQRWLVLLNQRHASAVDKDARAQAAGGMLARIHKALAGWRPEGATRTLRRASGRQPAFTKLSGLFPLTFEIDLNL